MDPDVFSLFLTRFLRLFSYGSLAVILRLYLISLSYSPSQISLIYSLTLGGDLIITFILTTQADGTPPPPSLSLQSL